MPASRANRGWVGVVGYGLLGCAIAQRLKSASFAVAAYDIVDRSRDMRAADVVPVSSVAALAQHRAVVLTVYSGEQVHDTLIALADASEQVREADLTVLVSTTLNPRTAVRAAEIADDAGLGFVEFPISGTAKQVAEGRALGLLGGDERRIDAHRDLISAITPRAVRLGPPGTAAQAKLAINLVLEINRSALAEGLVLAERMGLDRQLFSAALRDSAAYSAVMDGKEAKMRERDFAPEGRVRQSLKDVEMMLAEAGRHEQQLPLTEVQFELLTECVRSGWQDLDGAVVIDAIKRRRGSGLPTHAGGIRA